MRALIVCLAMTAAFAAQAQTPAPAPAPSREALTLGDRAARAAQPRLEQGLQALVQNLATNYRTDSAKIGQAVDDRALDEVSRSEAEAEKPVLWSGMARLYAETYTVDELKALIAFYKANPGAPQTALPTSLGAKNDDIQRRQRELVAAIGPRIMQDFFGDYCSRSTCTDDVRRVAGLPIRAKPAAKATN
jgi:hypothetical protein